MPKAPSILLAKWTGPHGGVPPFDKVKVEDFKPALEAAGTEVEFLGELDESERNALFAESYATLMPGSWPEPFGLVAIESLACGTPVVARRAGPADPDAVHRDVEPVGVEDRVGGADGGQHPARLPGRPRRPAGRGSLGVTRTACFQPVASTPSSSDSGCGR